ncbi:32914_t:CDS:2, partial [Gigaspora margarita]
DEDPIEWFDDFERAAEANNWNGDRRLQIALGYPKEAAADWYREVRNSIKDWKTESEDDEEREKNQERVDMYATKFKRLLSRVNTSNCLPDEYIVRMFLSGLKGMNAALVAVAAPKSLKEAVAAARRVEAGNYYGQYNSEMTKQQKVKNELNEMKKKIDKMALNYAALAHKLEKGNRGQLSIKEKGAYQYYNCGETGHYSRDCLSEKKNFYKKTEEGKRRGSQAKLLNYCEISLENNGQSREMYNLVDESVEPKILKWPVNPSWNNCLRDRKLAKTQPIREEEGGSRREEDIDPIR